MSGHDTGEHGFLVHLDIVEGLEGQAEVTKEAVNSQQADNGEISQHAVERAGTIFSGNSIGIFIPLLCRELFVDLAALYQRVEDVEHGVATPSVRVLP